jgi:L-lactate permease|tara:strand:- start:33716 stop:34039 length:324 start_codon:yes stop_codon:yes gene_type:complete
MNITFDPLHMHAGLLVFFTALVAFRGFGSTALPLICVIAVEVVLLWSGLTGEESQGRLALNSFLSAIIWPFAIVVLGRLGFLGLLTPSNGARSSDEPLSEPRGRRGK